MADPSPEVEHLIRSTIGGVQLVVLRANLGFAEANNQAAALARGEYLVFLNDDAVPEADWLTWLVETADAHPAAGAVGSCMLFPDGRIQESGSIVWNDGSTMPIGRDLPGDALEWQFVRRADYCSACSLLVRKTTWDAVGGMDAEYFPIYYEDTDLCLAIRARGQHVLFEPRSRVRHHESASSHSSRYKEFLFSRNQRRLVAKWGPQLSRQEPVAPWSPAAVTRAVWRARGCPVRILVVDDRVPTASMGSGFGRMFETLAELADHGYAVSLAPTCTGDCPHETLIAKGIRIVTEPLSTHLSRPDVSYEAIIVSRPHNFEPVAAAARSHQPTAVLIYDAEALFWRRLDRQAQLSRNPIERQQLEDEAWRLQHIEQGIVRNADHVVTVSADEAAVLGGVEGHCPVHTIFPTSPGIALTSRDYHERRDIAFVAGWLAGPTSANADGLRWFVRAVLPLVRVYLPWVRLRVTGANPPPEIVTLRGPNVLFEGHVEALSDFYDAVRVVIVPMRYGFGVKIKTIESLQYGVPVVTTSLGAEGVDTRARTALDIADDPRQFADRVVSLLTDEHVWSSRRASIVNLAGSWGPGVGGTWPELIDCALMEARCHPPVIHTTLTSTI